MDLPLDSPALGKLRWRCRRGLLENDLLLERFFRRLDAAGQAITTRQADALMALMDLPDNDLLDLLLARREPAGELDRPDVHEVIALLRQPAARAANPEER
ncbi:MAG: succinate dehydrogenase assembly factor 2 [Burkholderiales bacterium]|nr:succinate dehydrogenase assembly factor 2 [Burkholderiales bacterium]